MCKLCWTLLFGSLVTVVIAIVIMAAGTKTTVAPDGREVIRLEPRQRDLVLMEMRTFVDSLRDMTQALGTDDYSLFQSAALKVGLKAQQGVPLDLMKALPLPFKQMGMDTHKKFDDLAARAEMGASNSELLQELSQLMNNCVSCHAAYQLQSPVSQSKP